MPHLPDSSNFERDHPPSCPMRAVAMLSRIASHLDQFRPVERVMARRGRASFETGENLNEKIPYGNRRSRCDRPGRCTVVRHDVRRRRRRRQLSICDLTRCGDRRQLQADQDDALQFRLQLQPHRFPRHRRPRRRPRRQLLARSPITNDDGATGISTFNRRSTVSLSGGFGELRLGRDYTPTFWNDTVFDPFGTNGVGHQPDQLRQWQHPAGTAWEHNYVRASNSIGYFLPPNLGGFYGQLQYACTRTPTAARRPTRRRPTATPGAMSAGASAGRTGRWTSQCRRARTSPSTPWRSRASQTINLGASYDFGPVKLFGELSNSGRREPPTSALGVLAYVARPASRHRGNALPTATITYTLGKEAEAIQWLHGEVEQRGELRWSRRRPSFARCRSPCTAKARWSSHCSSSRSSISTRPHTQ